MSPKQIFVAPALAALVFFGGLSCTSTKTATSPDGEHSIEWKKGMRACLTQAGEICGDKGYTILRGYSYQKLLGGASSSNRSMVETASVRIVCGIAEEVLDEDVTYELPKRTDAPLPVSGPPGPSSARALVCTPGATQLCVGPAACSGGQVCAADGAGFGACDCGTSTTAPSESQPKKELAPAKEGPAPQIPQASPAPTPLK